MKNQKAIFFFLLKFAGIYIVLNTVYAFWIESYTPLVDPFTRIVTYQSVRLISLAEEGVSVGDSMRTANVSVIQAGKTVVNVYEGCNGINVMIVFLAFVIAFTSTWMRTVIFGILGILMIYVFNLGRVVSLFFVAKYYPGNLYFVHKYLLTGLLYLFVFFLWHQWVNRVWIRPV